MRSRNGILIGLLAAGAVISYVDRGSLSVAAPAVSAELHLAPVRMVVLLSAYSWSYAALQLVAGWLADRFGVFSVLAIGLAIWTAATLGAGLTGVLAVLRARRHSPRRPFWRWRGRAVMTGGLAALRACRHSPRQRS
jgi:ACS family D-galactonate transporter-like MFS transporter